MLKKSIMAVVIAASLIVSSSAVAFAADSETLVGNGWWAAEGVPHSTGVAMPDGATVGFDISIAAPTDPNDTYAAFCVEASDGTNYFTTTSAGDCWGFPGDPAIGTVIKDTGKNDAVQGDSYHVDFTRTGNDFTATYTDTTTGEQMFSTLYFKAADGITFADPTTVYVMAQVGTMTVSVSKPAAAADDTKATSTDVPKTGVVGFGLLYGLGAVATGAVALKRRNK